MSISSANSVNGFIELRSRAGIEEKSSGPFIDISKQSDSLVQTVRNILSSGIVTVYGSYGSGKSQLITSILSEKYFSNYRKFHFDAWQYPNKQDLWEGFIVELVGQINSEKSDAVQRDLEGKNSSLNKLVRNVISASDPASTVFLGTPPGTIKATAGNLYDTFFHKSPAKRIDDYRRILEHYLDKYIEEENIVIVVEDVDRSGDYGVTFLETLSNFVTSNNIEKNIIILVPVDNITYLEQRAKYEKFTDFFFQFKLLPEDVQDYLSEIIQSKKRNNLYALSEAVTPLFNRHDLTMRKFKAALRQANKTYIESINAGFKPCWEIVFFLCLLNTLPAPKNNDRKFLSERLFSYGTDSPKQQLYTLTKSYLSWYADEFDPNQYEIYDNDRYFEARTSFNQSHAHQLAHSKGLDIPLPLPDAHGRKTKMILPQYYVDITETV